MNLKKIYEKCKKLDPKIWITLYVLVSAVLLYFYPPMQVSHFEINNSTTNANLENQYRFTLAQILGGGAVAIGIYFTWKNFLTAQEDLKTTKEGQITDRFTRAIDQLGEVDQLGNPAIEIRLGGIYALERTANESDKDYWPIIEILTAYIRKNSSIEDLKVKEQNKVPLDIQAILNVIGRRAYTYKFGEANRINLQRTFLKGIHLKETHLEGADLTESNFVAAHLEKAHLEEALLEKSNFSAAYLDQADLRDTYCEMAQFEGSIIEGANLQKANFERAILSGANLRETNCESANFDAANCSGAFFEKAHLEKASFFGTQFYEAHLTEANFRGASLQKANFKKAHLYKTLFDNAFLKYAHFEESYLEYGSFEVANLRMSHFEEAYLREANLKGANLQLASLLKADLEGANLIGAEDLTVDQLSKVKTLYKAHIDPKLEEELRAKGFSHLLDVEPDR